MSEPDDRLERTYRSLAREEPPASLDARVLAAARRAVARPSLARRWGVPVSLAALLVLAIGVTLEMQHEERGVESSTPEEPAASATRAAPEPQSAPLNAPAAHEAPATRELAKPFAGAPAAEPSRSNLAPQATRVQPAPMAPPPAAERRFAGPAASMAKRSAAGASADAMTRSPSPVDELEKIAKLRESGRDAEADRALDEFRKRFPDYRIDEATWERVKPR